jgi:hypothetical protein
VYDDLSGSEKESVMDCYGHSKAYFDFVIDGKYVSSSQFLEKVISLRSSRKQRLEMFRFQHSPP